MPPDDAAASADGRTAYISNYDAGGGEFNTLTAADLVGFKNLPWGRPDREVGESRRLEDQRGICAGSTYCKAHHSE